MNQLAYCPACQRPIPPDAPSGMCPGCLLHAARQQNTAAAAASPPPKPHQLQPLFPQLEIVELIGQGGMGAVYRARHTGLDRWVALKIFRDAEDPQLAERFQREAQALARLSHPNIVAVYDYGRVPEYHYLFMEFVDGPNLRQLVAGHALTPAETLELAPQLCDALQYAHDHGVVHRDIKPENVLLDAQGRLKIADFGLAKLVQDATAPSGLTQTHQVMGTWSYMAPEQIEHPLEVDHRADIYSLGVVLYELLTGELPVGRFPPPSRKVQVDVRLDEVVLRALEKEPALRYQHASDFKTDVEALQAQWNVERSPQPIASKPTTTRPPVTAAFVTVGIIFGSLAGLAFIAGSGNTQVIDRSLAFMAGMTLSMISGAFFVSGAAVSGYLRASRVPGPTIQRSALRLALVCRLAAIALFSLATLLFVAGSSRVGWLDGNLAKFLGVGGMVLGGALIVKSGWLQAAVRRHELPAQLFPFLMQSGVRLGFALLSTAGVLCFVAGGMQVLPEKVANFAGLACFMIGGLLWTVHPKLRSR